MKTQNLYYVPVATSIYNKAVKLMAVAGVEFDGTVNHLDAWMRSNLPEHYLDLLPKRKTQKTVYIPYVC